MALDERAFFTERPENRPAVYACPRCRRTHEYAVRWVRRVKKDRVPPGADERDRAKFAKLRDHLLRLDDEVVCKTCGRKFDIPSLHSLLFVDQIEGLPKDVEEEPGAGGREPGVASRESRAASGALGAGSPEPGVGAPQKKPLPPRFTRPSRGWK